MKKQQITITAFALTIAIGGSLFLLQNSSVSAKEDKQPQTVVRQQEKPKPTYPLTIQILLKEYPTWKDFDGHYLHRNGVELNSNVTDESRFYADVSNEGKSGMIVLPAGSPVEDQFATDMNTGEKIIISKASDSATLAQIKEAYGQDK